MEIKIVSSENIVAPAEEFFLLSFRQMVGLYDFTGQDWTWLLLKRSLISRIQFADALSPARKRSALLARAFNTSTSRSRGGALVTSD